MIRLTYMSKKDYYLKSPSAKTWMVYFEYMLNYLGSTYYKLEWETYRCGVDTTISPNCGSLIGGEEGGDDDKKDEGKDDDKKDEGGDDDKKDDKDDEKKDDDKKDDEKKDDEKKDD